VGWVEEVGLGSFRLGDVQGVSLGLGGMGLWVGGLG
jgi:hypothetical protein